MKADAMSKFGRVACEQWAGMLAEEGRALKKSMAHWRKTLHKPRHLEQSQCFGHGHDDETEVEGMAECRLGASRGALWVDEQ